MSTMDEIRLQDARVLIVDPQAHARQLLNDALHMIGFRAIDGLDNIADLRPAMDAVDPDIVFIDIDHKRPAASEAIRNIRAKKLGPNPFVIVVALTWILQLRDADMSEMRELFRQGLEEASREGADRRRLGWRGKSGVDRPDDADDQQDDGDQAAGR